MNGGSLEDDEAQAARSLAARRRRLTRTPPRLSPGRFWRRIGLVIVLVIAAVATQRNAFRSLSDRVFGAPVDWQNDYSMTTHLYDLIAARHLTDVPKACLLLNIHGNDPLNATTMDVFERPTEACMGPAHNSVRVLPRLFEVRVDRIAGRAETDSGSPGAFRPLN